jgi:proteasome lid subunit RPN8/RPN11
LELELGIEKVASGSSRTVTLERAALETLVAHAREEAPNECCGVLLGTASSIAEAARTRNIADQPRSRFLIDPKDYIDLRRSARARRLEVLGFYHSHPASPAVPSPTDRAEAAYPGHLYLIVGLAAEPPDVAIYRLDESDGGNFLRLSVVTVG